MVTPPPPTNSAAAGAAGQYGQPCREYNVVLGKDNKSFNKDAWEIYKMAYSPADQRPADYKFLLASNGLTMELETPDFAGYQGIYNVMAARHMAAKADYDVANDLYTALNNEYTDYKARWRFYLAEKAEY